jgi:succinyldiaminopimelate transaminase
MTAGFVPPPYPHDRLVELRQIADAVPGGVVDASVGTPVDRLPDAALGPLVAAAAGATGYPPSIGTLALREAASSWVERRFAVTVPPADVIACVGTKEVVASLPRLLSLRDPARDTVLYPAVSYPTYEMGARLAGLRAVPVPVDRDWRLDFSKVSHDDARRALLLWLNEPTNPTGTSMTSDRVRGAIEWARGHGAIVASDECYAEFTYDDAGEPAPPVTALAAGTDGVLAVHSLSKRSNMAGLRAGFVTGDGDLVRYLGEVRKHAGLIVPTPVQAAAAAALGDDEHVREQRARYARRRKLAIDGLRGWGLAHDGGPSTFYLWLCGAAVGPHAGCDGWELARRLAEAGTLVMPGDTYGPAGVDHVRLSLTVTDDRLALALDRLASAPA